MGPDERVALCVERASQMVVGLLADPEGGRGVRAAGSGYPPERLEYMLADSEPVVVLTDER